MAEFIGGEEKIVNVGEPVVFENKTDSDFEVDTGVIFHKSGLYEVSIIGKRIIISNVTGQKEKMADLISRQEVIEALGEEPEVWEDDDQYSLGQRDQWRADVTAIECMPSVQSEQL